MITRRATPADTQAIAETHVASWQVAYRGFFPDAVLANLSVVDRHAMWERGLSASDPTIWVTGEAPLVTGFISVCPSRDTDLPSPVFSEIAALYIRPNAWGTGCGHALCQAAFAHLRQTEATTAIVWVLTSNARARHFYESIGFTTDDTHRDITLFNVTLPEIRYRQSLR